MIKPPYLPDAPITDTIPWQTILGFVLILSAVLAVAICVAQYSAKKFKGNKKRVTICFAVLAVTAAVFLFCFFGFSAITLKGVILSLILLFASYSDIKRRECDDYIHVMLVIAAFIGTSLTSISKMIVSGIFIAVLMIMALFLSGGNIGGADIKLATSCAFVLGFNKAIIGLAAGLIFAVFVNVIKSSKKNKSASFPLIPYLAVGFMTAYFI